MTTPQADQAAPHTSRSAPLCSNCKHNAGEFCNHPAAPISVVTGKPTAQCQLSRYLSQDGGGPNCGMNGRLFEAKPSPAFHLNWGGWPVPEEKAGQLDEPHAEQVTSVPCLPGAVLLLLDAAGYVVFRKDLAGVGPGWVPCVEFTRAVLMGPQGIGKTTVAAAIRDALGLTLIVDEWGLGDPLPDGALGITNDGAAQDERPFAKPLMFLGDPMQISAATVESLRQQGYDVVRRMPSESPPREQAPVVAIGIDSTPHISRLAPLCEDCVHFVPHSRVRRRRCNHPAVPIIPLEGAQDEAYIGLNDCFSLRGDRGLCGSAGSLFSAKPGPDLSSEV